MFTNLSERDVASTQLAGTRDSFSIIVGKIKVIRRHDVIIEAVTT